MKAFVQRQNPLTKEIEWKFEHENFDFHQDVARASFADMLHDTERNIMYEKAIQTAINTMHHKGLKANILDIGTGTGLLSMMAVRHGADSVTACEANRPISKCAEEIINLNNYGDKIKIIPKKSTEIIVGHDIPFRANILVTEVFDTELIGEGALSTISHAHEHLLEKNCIVVPQCGTIYAHIIECPFLQNWNRIKNVFNDEGDLELVTPKMIEECRGSTNVHDLQLNQVPLEYIKTIVSPRPVMNFDFSGSSIQYERTHISNFKTENAGVAQMLLMWWNLNMDITNNLVLSCAPYWAHPDLSLRSKNKVPWRDHWLQAIYYFPQEVHVKNGEVINLASCHDEYSLWFAIKKDSKFKNEDLECPTCTCSLHNSYPRTRIGQLNDGRRIKKYLRLIKKNIKSNHIILILSHGFYPALVASSYAKKVYFLETNHMSKSIANEFVKENKLQNVEIIFDDTKIKDVINVVIAEPYFITSLFPWDNLQLLYFLTKYSYCLDENVLLFPQKASIKAVAVDFDHLQKIRSPLVNCQGFKMEPFDKLIMNSSSLSDRAAEVQPLWEYPGKATSKELTITEIKIEVPKSNISLDLSPTFKISKGLECNGIVVWIDWIFDSTDPVNSTISTGPVGEIHAGEYIQWDMYTRQGIFFLGSNLIQEKPRFLFSYNVDSGEIKFEPQF